MIAPAARITSFRAKTLCRADVALEGANSTPTAVRGPDVELEKRILVTCMILSDFTQQTENERKTYGMLDQSEPIRS
jgi:hypothetical protein